jgi:hypothetical protein
MIYVYDLLTRFKYLDLFDGNYMSDSTDEYYIQGICRILIGVELFLFFEIKTNDQFIGGLV